MTFALSYDELQGRLADERKERNEALKAFERSLQGDDPAEVYKALMKIDRYFCWREAMLCVNRIKGSLNPVIRFNLHQAWTNHGDHIRLEVGDDLLLIAALRKLLPTYRGKGKKLYRGDALGNRKHRTYGLSWTPVNAVARGFCKGFTQYAKGGSVLLETYAPEEAIIAKVFKRFDRFNECEYIIDRTKLGEVKVLESFPQMLFNRNDPKSPIPTF